MRAFSRSAGFAVTLVGFGAALAMAQSTSTASVDGRWDASLINNGTVIPFRLDISGSGPTVKGTFYDGFEPYDGTTSGTFQDGKLVLNAEHYLTTITATLNNGQLSGNVRVEFAADFAHISPRGFRVSLSLSRQTIDDSTPTCAAKSGAA